MDNVIKVLDQLLKANYKILSLVISFIFVVLFLIAVYFFLGKPFDFFAMKQLEGNLDYIYCLGLFSVVVTILSGMAIILFAKVLLEYFYEKDWIVAFNHAWDKNEQIRCIHDGKYVHVRSINNCNNLPPMIFYTFCSTCKMDKRLIHDDGRPIPLSNAINIVRGKREKWKLHNFVVEDKEGNFYCKQCYNRFNYIDNIPFCPLGCSNSAAKEEIEKIQTTSILTRMKAFLKSWYAKL